MKQDTYFYTKTLFPKRFWFIRHIKVKQSVLVALLCFSALNVEAKRTHIIIDDAKIRKSLISLYEFKNLNRSFEAFSLSQQVESVIKADLTFTGLFDFVVPKDVTPFERRGYEVPDINYKEWGRLATEFLIKGGFELNGDNFSLDVRLYDIGKARLVLGKKYTVKKSDIRTLAHHFSNDAMESLTGQKGIFQTKILFVSNQSKHKELYVMDYDGANIQQLTFFNSIVTSPGWSPFGKTVTYSRYATHKNNIKNLDLFSLNLRTGKERLLSDKSGLNTGARWSPNGKHIALTMSYQGNPELYLINRAGKQTKRLTRHGAIDVEPAWSPDGKSLAFSSGRAPHAHLYLMPDIHSKLAKRLTFAGRYNSSPSWSPKGKKIVFAAQDKGHYDLFLVNSDGRSLRRLTKSKKGENNEYPNWSPDGRHILFSSNRTGKYGLYIINSDGSNERKLLTQEAVITYPTWSPYLNSY